jgi:hypothetical protein
MRKLVSCLCLLFVMTVIGKAADRQPLGDYHARREALAKKVGGVVVLFAGVESEGPNNLYGFRQEDNYYYLSGIGEAGSALLIAPATEAKGDTPARPYSEILFLPPRNSVQEKWTGRSWVLKIRRLRKSPASIMSRTWPSCRKKQPS